MSVYQPTYRDSKTGEKKNSAQWWYNFVFDGERIREPAKTAKGNSKKPGQPDHQHGTGRFVPSHGDDMARA
jgi:hypothetical protein